MLKLNARVAGQPVKITVLPWPEELHRFRAFCSSDPDGIYGLDVETTSIEDGAMFNPAARLRLIQFGTADEAWVLDPHDPFWRPYIERVLDSEREFVSHTNYDVLWTRREFGIDLGDRSIDTIILASLIEPGERNDHTLKGLSKRWIDKGLVEAEAAMLARFTELEREERVAAAAERIAAAKAAGRKPTNIDKNLGAQRNPKQWGFTNIPLDDPNYGLYAGLDAIYVRRLLPLLAGRLSRRTYKLSRREQAIARMATDIRWRGHRMDPDYTNELLSDIEWAYNAAEDRLTEVLGFSPRSPKVGPWLAERGVEFIKLTDTGKPSLTKETLPVLHAIYEADSIVGPVLADKIILSENSNLLTNLRGALRGMDEHGLIHPAIKTCAAVTGRMSVTGPPMQTYKKNDKRLRGCWISREGHVFVGADYDSQELRLAYAFSRDKTLGRVLSTGVSQHVVTAEMIFGSKFKSKIETPELYDQAKITNFSQQYGVGPKTLGDSLGMPRGPKTERNPEGEANPKARALWLAWREAYSGLVEWTDKMAERPVVVNPWGRMIPRDTFRHYANGNYMIQSSGRDVLGDAMIELRERGWGDTIWLPIHDELVLEVPEDDAEEACKVLSEAMYCVVQGVELTATATIIGTRWNGEE